MHYNVIFNKVSSIPVDIIPNCLINNEFAVELLKYNDLFIHTVNDRVVLKKDVDISNNIPFKNDNNFSLLIPSVPINVSTTKDSIKHRLLANNKDVGIPNKIDVHIPKKKSRHTFQE